MGVGLELYGLRKDGSEVPLDIMLKSLETEEVIRSKDGQPAGFVKVTRDVTALRSEEVCVLHLRIP